MSVDPEQGTPEGGSPTGSDPQPPQENWEQRYKDTHSWGAKAQQERDEYKAILDDPDRYVGFGQENHPHLIHEDEDEYDPDPTPAEHTGTVDPRLDALWEREEKREQQEQHRAVQEEWAGWGEHVVGQAKQEGHDLADWELDAMKLHSVDPETGYPVPQDKANEVLKQYLDKRNAWLDEQVKQRAARPRAPHVPAGGPPGEPEPPKTHQDRVARAMERMNAEQA